jgi:hypothetical protein
VADVWGLVAAVAGGAHGRVGMSACRAGLLGRLLGHASWAGLRTKQGWLAGRAGRAGCEAFSLSFLFLFYFSSSLFEFKFDLEFEFKTSVPY